jgi:hypothetical protein
MNDYERFLDSKSDRPSDGGFEPVDIPDFLFPFQRFLLEWAIRLGRGEIMAACGLGKTPMQLAWADNVARHTNRPVLILTPLAVSGQTVREARKFGLEAEQSRDGKFAGKVVVTNYEKLHLFRPGDFAGVVCDESSCLKDFDGKTRLAITEFMRTLEYRLLCSATPAPNDYVELGTSSEALGHLGYQDMITRFFKQETKKDHLGWGRTKYRMRPHGEHDFWRWVCSWARACRRPSDLGDFDDTPYLLPAKVVREHAISARTRQAGKLFDMPAITIQEQAEERRRTINERCEKVAELVDHDRPAVCWAHLNPEGDLLERLIPGSVQVAGHDPDEAKEEAFTAFVAGQIRVLITKPSIGAWGLNWEHCAHQTFFPSHSYEQFHQCIHRSHRYGQAREVEIDMVAGEGDMGVMANLQRKAEAAETMYDRLVALMHDHLKIRRTNPFTASAVSPPWLAECAR